MEQVFCRFVYVVACTLMPAIPDVVFGQTDDVAAISFLSATTKPSEDTVVDHVGEFSNWMPGPGETVAPVIDESESVSSTSPDSFQADQSLVTGRVPIGGPAVVGSPSTLGANSQKTSIGSWIRKTAGALGVVIALILLLRWIWARVTGHVPAATRSAVVEILSRTTIASRNHVLLLRIGGRIIVVNDSSAGMRTLANIDEPEEVASLLATVTANQTGSITQGFSQILHRFNSSYIDDDCDQDAGYDGSEFRVDRDDNQLTRLLTKVRTFGTPKGTNRT